jgi:UDP-glucuronate 4-epimerase
LRFFTVYGPWGRPDMALFKFAKKIMKDEPIDVYNNGNMERDFTYIDDIVEGVVKIALGKPPKENKDWDGKNPDPATSSVAPFKIYNIGRGKPCKLMDYIHGLEKALGKKAVINMLPMQAGEVLKTWADSSELYKKTKYKPKVSIEEGIKNFAAWFKDYYK